MKKSTFRITICLVALLALFSARAFSQSVGVSDASGFTPQVLFHIYKSTAGPSTLFQIANSTVGSGANVGFTFDVDASFNINMNNRASTSLGFNTNGTPRMTILGNGNVGIGTVSPAQKLDVTGNINYTGALYVNGNAGTNGQLLYSTAGGTNGWLAAGTSGYLLVSTGAVPSWSSTSTIGLATGTGTLNYLARWTSGTTLSTGATYDNGTNVGIGTTSPLGTLHVNSTITGTSRTSNIYVSSANNTAQKLYIGINSNGGATSGDYASMEYLQEGYHWGNLALQADGGSVGIGTTTPRTTVDINGSLDVGTYGGITSTPAGYGTIGLSLTNGGYYGVLFGQTTSNPNEMWDGSGNGGVYYQSSGTWLYYSTASNHFIGIGTTAPAYTVDVEGNFYTSNIVGQTSSGSRTVPAYTFVGAATTDQTVTITKELASTPLICEGHGGGVTTSSYIVGAWQIYCSTNSTIYALNFGGAYGGSKNCGTGITAYITGLAAGSYTFVLRHDAGMSTCTTSNLTVFELKQ